MTSKMAPSSHQWAVINSTGGGGATWRVRRASRALAANPGVLSPCPTPPPDFPRVSHVLPRGARVHRAQDTFSFPPPSLTRKSAKPPCPAPCFSSCLLQHSKHKDLFITLIGLSHSWNESLQLLTTASRIKLTALAPGNFSWPGHAPHSLCPGHSGLL